MIPTMMAGALGSTEHVASYIDNLCMDLDISNSGSITYGVSPAIIGITDQSGYGSSASCAAGGPTIITAAQNGHDVLRFTAANSNFMSFTSIDFSTGGYTIIACVRRGGPSGTGVVELLGNHTTAAAASLEWYGDRALYIYDAAHYYGGSSQSDTSGFHVISGYVDNAGAKGIFFDGASQSVTAGNQTGSLYFDQIGFADNGYGNYDLGQIRVFLGVLSDADRQTEEAAMKTKWATP